MHVILTELPISSEINERYPPIIERDREEIKNGNDVIEWALYEKVPIFLWYPPYEITPKHLEDGS